MSLSIKNKQPLKSGRLHPPSNTFMKMALPIETSSQKTSSYLMEFANYAILVGQPFVMREERLTAAPLIMQLQKSLREKNTICQSTYGASAF